MRIWNWYFWFIKTSCDSSMTKIWRQFNEEKFEDLFLSYLNELEISELRVYFFKKTLASANLSKFVSQELSKALMQRKKLRDKFLRQNQQILDWLITKQRNICVSFLGKTKKSEFENLDITNLRDNRKFWGAVKRLFSNKLRSNDYITLNENDFLIRSEYKNSKFFKYILC